MKIRKIFIILWLLIMLIVGCSRQNIVDGQFIHSEQRAFDLGESVEIAYNDEDYKKLWNNFKFTKTRPNVKFESSAILFAQTYESSCPKKISTFEINSDTNRLIVETMEEGGAVCNDIGIPKTFVFQIDIEKLEKLETIQFEGEVIDLDHDESN